jgi:predicted N-acetyltransferase YhbS
MSVGFEGVPFEKIEDVRFRVLAPHESGKLMPLLKENGWGLPYPDQATAVVGEYQGKIVAFVVLQMLPMVGPVWVEPSWRGSGLAEGIVKELVKRMIENGKEACIAIAQNPFTEHFCRVLGMTEVDGKLFKRD